MKKVKLLLIGIIGVFAMSTLKVDAAIATGTDETTKLGYSIESFHVFVRNGQGLLDLKTPPDNSSKTWEKTIDGGALSINPSSKVYKLKNNAQLITVKLNTTGGMDKIISTLENTVRTDLKEKITGGDNERYFVSFSVTYKITAFPAGATNIVDVDHKNVFSDVQERQDVTRTNDTGLSQMIYSAIYDKTNDRFEGKDATLSYDGGGKTITARGDDMPVYDEFYLMKDGNKEGLEVYRFMVHDRDDLMESAYFLEDLADSEKPQGTDGDDDADHKASGGDGTPVSPSSSSSKKNEKITGVPNTDARSMSITLFGSSLLALGSSVVLWELRKKFN